MKTWQPGQTVKVGGMTLVVKGVIKPNVYLLSSVDEGKAYVFGEYTAPGADGKQAQQQHVGGLQ